MHIFVSCKKLIKENKMKNLVKYILGLFCFVLFCFIGLYLSQNLYSSNLPLSALLANKKEGDGKISLCGDEKNKFRINYITEKINVDFTEKSGCATIYIPLTNDWHNYKADILVLTQEKIRLILSSRYQWVNEGYSPIFVSYKEFKSNMFEGFNTQKIISQNNPYIIEIENINNKIPIYFEFKARLNKFQYKDLYTLYNFNLPKFLIILVVLSFLYFFLLCFLKYTAEYVFIFLFFFVLIFPVSHTSKDILSIDENRILNKFPSFNKNGKMNFSFGLEFENWLSDHFWGRKYIIKYYNKLSAKLKNSIGNNLVYNQWYYLNEEQDIIGFSNSKYYTDGQLEKIGNYLNEFSAWCKKNDKYFIFMIAPYKHRIYPEYYPQFINKINPDIKSPTNQLINYLQKKYKLNILYPVSELIKNKDNGLIFYKNDLHWTDLGAYYAYLSLLENITQNYSKMINYKTRNKIFYETIKYYSRSGIHNSRNFINQYFSLDEFYCTHNITEENDNVCHNVDGNMRIFVLGDSFVSPMYAYINNDFKQSFFRNRRNYGIEEKHFEKLKESDIIFLEIYENKLHELEKYSFPKRIE